MKNTSGFHFILDAADFSDEKLELPWPAKEKVSVVSVIGKSSGRIPDGKDCLYRQLIGHSTRPPTVIARQNNPALWIEGFYSALDSTVYLQIHSALDTNNLIQCCLQWGDRLQRDGFLACWTDMRLVAARALLWTFLLSHVVVLYTPGSSVDISLVPLLQAVDTCRHKVYSHLGERLSRIDGVSSSWMKHARLCTPRLLFYFGSAPPALSQQQQQPTDEQVHKLSRCLQSQIRHTLRHSRLMSGGSGGAGGSGSSQYTLFSLPANPPYVHVHVGTGPGSCHVGLDSGPALRLLQQLCTDFDSSAVRFSAVAVAAVGGSGGGGQLVKEHVRAGVERGMDGGRQHGHFLLPAARVWYRAARELFAAIVLPPIGNSASCETSNESRSLTGLARVLANFDTALGGDVRFSEVRCSRAVPVALALYKEGLPSRYSATSHERRVRLALGAFSCRARGPACVRYASVLRDRCDRVWQQGRRMCEQMSLTGNPCINPVHSVPDERQDEASAATEGGDLEDQEGGAHRPTMQHCSGVRYLATCNCGRTQAQKNDPYSVRYANHEFYEELAQSCCARLAKHKFAVFSASAQHWSKAAVVSAVGGEDLVSEEGGAEGLGEHDEREESLGQLYGHGLSQGNASDIEEGDQCAPHEDHSPSDIALPLDDRETHVAAADCSAGSEAELLASTEEYLAGMPTTATPSHLLPKYSSFSLLCTGPSSFYSHVAGLHGFVAGSNYLLPWELRFKQDQQQQQQQRTQRRYIRRRDDLYAKIFIGFEYECPRGHRFLMAAKDRVLKAASCAHLKANVAELVNSEMSVYFNCLCSQPAKPFVAQLMRIHVVTAKSAVRVTMTLRVQPGGMGSAVFVPQSGCGAIELSPSAYWTYRLPHIYVDGGTVYAPPKREVPPTGAGRLLPDLFGVVIRDEAV